MPKENKASVESILIFMQLDFAAHSPELEEPLLEAMKAWNMVPCQQKKLVLNPKSLNRVVLKQKSEWDLDPKALGVTRQDSVIQIEINQGDHIWSKTDYRNILLHELGHALGLPHLEAFNSVMYEQMQLGDGEWQISPGDQVALCALPAASEQQHVGGCAQSGSSPDMGLLVSLMIWLFVARHVKPHRYVDVPVTEKKNCA